MEIVTQSIPTLKIWPNTGQIAGIPKNPRFIRDERFAKLVRSIIDHPEMLGLENVSLLNTLMNMLLLQVTCDSEGLSNFPQCLMMILP